MIDGLQLWGTVCGQQSNCQNCPIGSIRGTNVTCQDFAAEFPAKMLSILTEMKDEGISFFNEYSTRFPECNLDVETLSQVACRKAVFEGYTACPGGDCVACWKEKYTGDVTEVADDSE